MKERRNRTCGMHVALTMYALVWFGTVSYGAPQSQSISEHATDIIQLQWKTILGLVGLVQVLIGYVYISGIRSLKDSTRKIFDRIDELEQDKLSKEDHNTICNKK